MRMRRGTYTPVGSGEEPLEILGDADNARV